MKCESVLNQLSSFMDEVLDQEKSDRIARHLDGCAGCHREFKRLAQLRRKLASLQRVEPPEYLRHLIELRLDAVLRETWRDRLKNAWEYRWSKIRTTEGMWYVTRLLGTATTFIFFLVISASMGPAYLDFSTQSLSERSGMYQVFGKQLLRNFGYATPSLKPRATTEPKMNDLYFVNFGQSTSRAGKDDNFSVVMAVDPSGIAKIQSVLEYPSDTTLLADLSSMIKSARCRPAIQNGRAVESHMVLSFSSVSVYE